MQVYYRLDYDVFTFKGGFHRNETIVSLGRERKEQEEENLYKTIGS